MPHAHEHQTLDDVRRGRRGRGRVLGQHPGYAVSLLKAYFGDAATADNDFCFDYLPRLTGDHGTYQTVLDMIDGKVQGLLPGRREPCRRVTSNGKMQRLGLAKLDWLVVRDLVMIESATFWKDGPEIETGELRTEDIATEVFFLPAAAHTEKDGSFTNTQRLLQWHHKAVEPPGDAPQRPVVLLPPRPAHPGEAGRLDRPRWTGRCSTSTWAYPSSGAIASPSAEAVLREINGIGADGAPSRPTPSSSPTGRPACGCWIYCGVYADGVNQAARRKPGAEQSWVAPEWGWAWPANRRILYNRASADPDGKPWSERKAYVWWDGDEGKWTGHDVPDFIADREPHHVPADGRQGPGRHRRLRPLRHAGRREGRGCSPPRASPTGRCRPTTSRRVTGRQPPLQAAEEPSQQAATTAGEPDEPAPRATSSPSCSRPTG